MPSPALSKSLFKLGLACPLRLKHALARPALPRKSDENEYMQLLARGGYMFEKLVRIYHPGEDMFVPQESHAEASTRTIAKIKAGDCMLHETTFACGDLMARCDMVRVTGEGFLIPDRAKPLTRMIARAFDAYDQSKAQHSAAV